MADPETLLPISVIILGWMVAGGSPGPATLAISGVSMQQGRIAGLTLAAGILLGSASWGIAAGLGFSAVMVANVWMFEALRYLGAAYLLCLASKSLRSAYRGGNAQTADAPRKQLFANGLLLHLTNPKAVLGWGAIYAISLPPGAEFPAIWTLFMTLFAASTTVFLGYAIVFSWPPIARGYAKARRFFDAAFGILFGLASFKILTARLI